MFEQEMEMEKRAFSIAPLLLILGVAALIIGSLAYWIIQAKQVMTPEQASAVVNSILKAQGPTKVRFYTGMVQPSIDEKPSDPHYKLLEKGGYIKLGKAKGDAANISLTAKAEQEFAGFPEFQKRKLSDGTEQLTVALAQRKLINISKVTMNGPKHATVEYTWKWEPTTLGDLFDPSGAAMKGFSIWETQKLIEKYGANYYHEKPAPASLRLVKDDQGAWSVSRD